MADDLNIFANGRQPQYFSQWKTASFFGLSINHNINKENSTLVENTEIYGDMIKEASGGGGCDDPGLEDADAPAAQGDGKAEEYQEGRGPELHQHVDRLGVQVQGDGLEGRGQHPRVGGQLRVKLETVKLRKKKGMPRDGLVQARISNFVQKFPILGLARGVANGNKKNLSDLGDIDLAGNGKTDGQVDLTGGRGRKTQEIIL